MGPTEGGSLIILRITGVCRKPCPCNEDMCIQTAIMLHLLQPGLITVTLMLSINEKLQLSPLKCSGRVQNREVSVLQSTDSSITNTQPQIIPLSLKSRKHRKPYPEGLDSDVCCVPSKQIILNPTHVKYIPRQESLFLV
jgi:hypothetical protein